MLVALLGLSFWCLVIVVWLYLAVPWVCLQYVIVVFPDHTYLLFFGRSMHYFQGSREHRPPLGATQIGVVSQAA